MARWIQVSISLMEGDRLFDWPSKTLGNIEFKVAGDSPGAASDVTRESIETLVQRTERLIPAPSPSEEVDAPKAEVAF